ncbi:class I SAM-dependent methyltransferase [Affinibrenneria salicis]|uniref:Class I SAM-dependent methyltransferase n=1 Tax=Affinibrenneria salicis TaxID=2590031 RepID=A0A5J5G244_9GAMM|nr:class I SAM-dependent methyltransferase [Affinibrenneria salicis]KAA9000695.1 class I SAM-dependent methyltransferase [Affinibrenneria salicis]
MSNPQQNVYDDPLFFAEYKALRQNDSGLNGALEMPALRKLLPRLQGLTVLDIGSGFGDFARYARAGGAREVIGVEPSARMLEEAIRLTNDANISYRHVGVEQFDFPDAYYDLVVSSLALHYVQDFSTLCLNVYKSLRPGGRFIFSVEHPICTAYPHGWVTTEEGRHWPVKHYQDESVRHTRWFIDDVIKYHRTVETYITDLLAAGFSLSALKEPQPLPEFVAARPEIAVHNQRPPFLLISAAKPLHGDE